MYTLGPDYAVNNEQIQSVLFDHEQRISAAETRLEEMRLRRIQTPAWVGISASAVMGLVIFVANVIVSFWLN